VKYAVSVCGLAEVVLAPGQDETEGHAYLEAQLDEVMAQLLELEESPDLQVTDSDISATLADGRVEISVVIEADSLDKATVVGHGAIRSAVHAAGGHTPGWQSDHAAAWELDVQASTQRSLDPVA
jgi:hypothetical protein